MKFKQFLSQRYRSMSCEGPANSRRDRRHDGKKHEAVSK